jgi:hypothetical protein
MHRMERRELGPCLRPPAQHAYYLPTHLPGSHVVPTYLKCLARVVPSLRAAVM